MPDVIRGNFARKGSSTAIGKEVVPGRATQKTGKFKQKRGAGKSLINDLENILGGTRSHTDEVVGAQLAAFIDHSDELLNRSHALAMVRLASKYRFDVSSAISLERVVDLFDVKRLNQTSHEVEPIWEGYMLSQALYGLRMFSPRTKGIDAFLAFLYERLEESKREGKFMNNQEVANSLYGFQQFDHSIIVDKILLEIMELSIKDERTPNRSSQRNTFGADEDALDEATMKEITVSPINGQEIGMALYGLRSMSPSHHHSRVVSPVLLYVLDFLTQKIAASSAPLTPQACASALNGMRGLNPSKNQEVQKILEALLPKILVATGFEEGEHGEWGEDREKGQRLHFNSISIGSALSGFKAMDATTPVVAAILNALAYKIEQSSEIYNQDTVASCMVGMQSMSDDSAAVRRVLAALTEKLNQHPNIQGGTVKWASSKTKTKTKSSSTPSKWSSSIAERKNDGGGGLGADFLLKETEILATHVTGDHSSPSVDMEDVEGEIATFSAGNIALCLTSMRRMSGKYPQTRGFLDAMQRKVMVRAKQPFKSQDIGRSLYGLQSMSVTTDQRGKYGDVLRVLTGKLLRKLEQMEGQLLPRDIGSALYGLKSSRIRREGRKKDNERDKKNENENENEKEKDAGKPSLEHEVTELLTHMAVRIASAPDTSLSAQSFGMALLGMMSMSSDVREVQQVLHALTPRLKASTLDHQACANILYGMRSMSSGRSDVRNFLAVLAPKIHSCAGSTEVTFTPQEISNCFYGLQNMDSKHVETVAVLVSLAKGLKQALAATDFRIGSVHSSTGGQGRETVAGAAVTSQCIGNAFFGFQTMENNDNTLVDECLGLLADLMDRMDEDENNMMTMLPHDLANALMGLQGIENFTPPVQQVLRLLTCKMRESRDPWTAREIGYALVGMSGLQQAAGDREEVINMVSEINFKMSQSELQGLPGVTFKLFGKGFKIFDATGAVIMKG